MRTPLMIFYLVIYKNKRNAANFYLFCVLLLEVTKLLLFVAQASHEYVPPDVSLKDVLCFITQSHMGSLWCY